MADKGRQALLDYLLSKADDYEHAGQISATGGGADIDPILIPVCERPAAHSGYDVFGVHWSKAKPTCHYTQGQDPIIHALEDWREEVRFPKVERFDWGFIAEQVKKLDRVNKVSIATMRIGPFERCTALTSFEDCLVNAISEPEEFAALIDAIADYKIALIDYLYKTAQPDAINLHDDWGTAQSTFLSPDLWRTVLKPATKRLYDAIHEREMIAIQHSCGAITPLLDDVVEIGLDAWEAQPNCNDISALVEKYRGKLCIIAPPDLSDEDLLGPADAPEPKIEDMPLTFRPYPQKPTFLWD